MSETREFYNLIRTTFENTQNAQEIQRRLCDEVRLIEWRVNWRQSPPGNSGRFEITGYTVINGAAIDFSHALDDGQYYQSSSDSKFWTYLIELLMNVFTKAITSR